MRQIDYIVVHCTGASPRQTVDSIRAYWLTKGWKLPGYHYLVPADGTRHVLQTVDKTTNGVAGYNSRCIHICYVGGMSVSGKFEDTRTQAQKAEIEKILKELRAYFKNAKIVGHRDLSPDINKDGKISNWEYIKACPCFDAIPEYAHI